MPRWESIKPKTITCQRCGSVFESIGNNTKYCPECRNVVRLEKSRERHRAESKKSKVGKLTSGTDFDSYHAIAADCRAARAMGLTYGIWRARYG